MYYREVIRLLRCRKFGYKNCVISGGEEGMNEIKEISYYRIWKSVFGLGVIAIVFVLLFSKQSGFSQQERIHETYLVEYGKFQSKLQTSEECYLCGNSSQSLIDYYRKFDTVGIIGLNEWCVLDLHLKEYDEQGSELKNQQGSKTFFGNTQGVNYYVSSTPSKGMVNVKISSEEDNFNSKIVEEHLCQKCLDKVMNTLEEDQIKDEKGKYVPFVLVDFKTLELYSLQKQNVEYLIRDYRLDIEYGNEIEIVVHHEPQKDDIDY